MGDGEIEDLLNIPSVIEDEEDFSDGESNENMEKNQSIQHFLSESLSDVESLLSPLSFHLSPMWLV